MASSSKLDPILITGGCGFIGYHLVQHLLDFDSGCRIHVLDITTERNRIDSVTYHRGDIASANDVSRVMQEVKPRVVFHVACPDPMVIATKLFEKVVVGGARNLLSSAAAVGTVQAFVYTSSSSVIHDNMTDLIDAHETLPILRPPVQKRTYTLTKATAEEEILAANRAAGDRSMLTVSLRPCTTFGERDTTYITRIIGVAQKGSSKYQMGNGKNVYDFVYVGNLVDAHILAARALVDAYGVPPPSAETRVDGEKFNITNDERVLFWDFTRQIGAKAGYPVAPKDIVAIPVPVALVIGWVIEWVVWIFSRGQRQSSVTVEGIRLSTINRTLSVEKAKRVLKYKPRVSIEEGIENGVQWWIASKGKSQ